MSACILLIGIKHIARQRYKKWIGKRKCFFAGKASRFRTFSIAILAKSYYFRAKNLAKSYYFTIKNIAKSYCNNR